ncbi:MAG TPA: DUF4402 domain-containing protein [Allosphingosinicella sp.]|nr:DUF4402 domain-containing protein [Allosphingosinicella sp.]
MAGTAVFAVTLGAGAVQAAPATASADAKAKVLKQISVTKTADLDFGTIVVSTTAGTVAIATDGTLSCAAALTCSGSTSAAGFTISGSKNEFVTISGDNSAVLKNADDNSKTMTASLDRSAETVKLNNTGGGSFTVGGTLSVAASQVDGLYQGSFNVTVDYQ